MANIKRQFSNPRYKGYILLESLLSLSLLAAICIFVLSEVNQSQGYSQKMNRSIENLNVAKMALDVNLPSLTANGSSINIEQNDQRLQIFDSTGKEELRLEILEIQK
ncbi:hypothetical protein OfM1_16940 [Lactovum odontotermitis]